MGEISNFLFNHKADITGGEDALLSLGPIDQGVGTDFVNESWASDRRVKDLLDGII